MSMYADSSLHRCHHCHTSLSHCLAWRCTRSRPACPARRLLSGLPPSQEIVRQQKLQLLVLVLMRPRQTYQLTSCASCLLTESEHSELLP